MDERETLRKRVEEKRDQIIEMQRDLTAVPALAPQNGGTGEWEKAQVAGPLAHAARPRPLRIASGPGPARPAGERPNLAADPAGPSLRRVVLDHVPPGHRAARASCPSGNPIRTRSS